MNLTATSKAVKMASACGKIIISGEYAVVFGYPGIAIPSPLRIHSTYKEAEKRSITWSGIQEDAKWNTYAHSILDQIALRGIHTDGNYQLSNELPLGKGMGSSTALVIALCRLFEVSEEDAKVIEDNVNPGNSGIDFSVIWNEKTFFFEKGKPSKEIHMFEHILQHAVLIDTGTPNETTSELVMWIKGREEEVSDVLKTIGQCTTRLLTVAEDRNLLLQVIRDHHQAQIALGVVPDEVQQLIAEIESLGGAAKVIGAGGRTGGAGIVLALNMTKESLKDIVQFHRMTIL